MSERRFRILKAGTFIATPLAVVGSVAFAHGKNVENSGFRNRQTQRDAISRQVDGLFPSYDQNAVENASLLIPRLQHELATLIAEGKIDDAKNTLNDNRDGINQLGLIQENEALKSGIKSEIISKKDLTEYGKGSWYTLAGAGAIVAGTMSFLSGAVGEATYALTRRKQKSA